MHHTLIYFSLRNIIKKQAFLYNLYQRFCQYHVQSVSFLYINENHVFLARACFAVLALLFSQIFVLPKLTDHNMDSSRVISIITLKITTFCFANVFDVNFV